MPSNRQTPRWKEIYEQLRQEVSNFEYGSRFYTISDICEKFDVSTITARRVLNELSNDGLVEKIPKRGTVIRQPKQQISVRMLIPSEARENYPNYTEPSMRKFAGVTTAAARLNLNFAPMPESDVRLMKISGKETFGLIIPQSITWQTIEAVQEQNIPYVMLDPEEDHHELPHVRGDRFAAGYEGTKYLLSLGHRRIAYLLGHLSMSNFRERLNGYRKALKEAKIKFDWKLIRESNAENVQENYWSMHRLMQLKQRPTAIMTGDDERAMHILSYCQKEGIEVPRQFSILGYPNYASSALTDPPLSVMDAQYEQTGEAAVKLLLDQISDGSADKPIIATPKLVIRGTTGPAPQHRKTKTRSKSKAKATRG